MKHLYKTKEGEILEAVVINYLHSVVILTENNEEDVTGTEYNLSEVQEVVLDKDGEPFMFEGEVVCVGDTIRGYSTNGKIIKYLPVNNGIHILLSDNEWIHSTNITSHTPKHPQKKGIEKMDEKDFITEENVTLNPSWEIIAKLNELIEVVNKLKQ